MGKDHTKKCEHSDFFGKNVSQESNILTSVL